MSSLALNFFPSFQGIECELKELLKIWGIRSDAEFKLPWPCRVFICTDGKSQGCSKNSLIEATQLLSVELLVCILLACDRREVVLLKFSFETSITHSVTSGAGQKCAQPVTSAEMINNCEHVLS